MQDPVILVVDDDLDILETLTLVLETEGDQVVTAVDGTAALEVLHGGVRPALILLDLMMPGMNGSTFMERLREDEALSELPVVVLSGDRLALRRPPEGVVECLGKPVELETLRDAVKRHRRD